MTAVSRRRMLQMALAPAALASAQVDDIAPTVSRVYPGSDGKLVCVPDDQGNIIPDCSHVGYGGGGVPIPTAPVKETIWPVPGDNTANVQAAIDKVSALPLDRNGFRGAVLLRAGYYRMATPAKIQASGVVLRGEGMSDTGTILVGTGNPRARGAAGGGGGTLVMVGGATGPVTNEDAKQTVADDYVPTGSRSIRVSNASALRPGDSVMVRRIGNQEWLDSIGMNGKEYRQDTWRAPFNVNWDRVVVDVQGNTITIDAPIMCAIEKRWGGGEVIKYDDAGRIEKVGVENLRGVSEFDPTVRTKDYGNMDRPNYAAEEYYSDEGHYWTLIGIGNARHAWVRNVTALHFGNSLAACLRGSKWVTIQDCVSRAPVSQRRGGRRFTYLLESQLALVQRCHSDQGRHNFVMGTASSSNVFLDCTATNPFSSSEAHAQWVTGGLWDNVRAPLTARFWKDINIGWSGANCVFWNCEGPFYIQKPPGAQNFSFGHIGVDAVIFNIEFQDPKKENGYIESLDRHVTPRSLYLMQLRERLGEQAVRNIVAPGQGV